MTTQPTTAILPFIRCPVSPRFEGDSTGCGSSNLAGPDHEGLYDCLDCGLFFRADADAAEPGDYPTCDQYAVPCVGCGKVPVDCEGIDDPVCVACTCCPCCKFGDTHPTRDEIQEVS